MKKESDYMYGKDRMENTFSLWTFFYQGCNYLFCKCSRKIDTKYY